MSKKRVEIETFSNDIADLPPIGEKKPFKWKNIEVPEEVKVKLDSSKEAKELAFRRWLISHKPKQALMTPIETSTVTGVPDIYCCHNGKSMWIECKINGTSQQPRIRGTQYSYLKKLIAAGGSAKIVVQQFSKTSGNATSIAVYDAAHIVSIPSAMFKHIGQELMFPNTVSPFYRWYYKQKDMKLADTLPDLYLHLLLDTSEFT